MAPSSLADFSGFGISPTGCPTPHSSERILTGSRIRAEPDTIGAVRSHMDSCWVGTATDLQLALEVIFGPSTWRRCAIRSIRRPAGRIRLAIVALRECAITLPRVYRSTLLILEEPTFCLEMVPSASSRKTPISHYWLAFALGTMDRLSVNFEEDRGFDPCLGTDYRTESTLSTWQRLN